MDSERPNQTERKESVTEQQRIDANSGVVQELLNDLEDDAMARDGTNLAGSSEHRFMAAASTSGMSSGMLSEAMTLMYRALSRDEFIKTEQAQLIEVDQRVREKAEDKREKEQERLRDAASDAREAQRAEWQRQEHSYAGVTMTGAEWGEMADALKGDTALRRWLMDRMMKSGKSQAEASRMTDEVSLLARMQSLPEDQWTDEMKDLDRELDADPQRRRELDGHLQAAASNNHQLEASQLRTEAGRNVRDAAQETSTESRAEIFASAPNLTEEHRKAISAEVPLDVRAPVIQQAANTMPSPQPARDMGGIAF